MSQPIRIQRKRSAGFNMQAQSPDGRPVVSVCRPGKWGNPFVIGVDAPGPRTAVEAFRTWVAGIHTRCGWQAPPTLFDIQADLRGKHLACFCAPDAPCHADVLLELANA